ncbi:hypothetical protein ACFE04_022682 [Oxalis oulophora]
MAKKTGPCYHCGTYSSPMWRNGPIEKSVLCNACGIRYKKGRPLENYVPKNELPRKRCVTSIASNGKITSRTQRPNDSTSSNNVSLNTNSAISSHESKICSKVEAEELTDGDSGLKEVGSWALNIPSKKRSTCVMFSEYEHIRHLRRDLYNILVKQDSPVYPELNVHVDNSDHFRHREMLSGAILLPPDARK